MTYEADEKGYRVTSMESVPIGEGPEQNKLGRAIVQSYVSGVETQYAIQAQPVGDMDNAGADGDDEDGLKGRQADVELVDVTPVFLPGAASDDDDLAAAAAVEI